MRVAEAHRHARKGPLAVRWHAVELAGIRAGVLSRARVEIENEGTAAWTSLHDPRIYVSYHWLDPLGNAIVWAGIFQPLPRAVRPDERVAVELPIRGPIPPGPYRLALDLIAEGRCWFVDVGNARYEVELTVPPRIDDRVLSVELGPGDARLAEETRAALAAQEEAVVLGGHAVAVAYLVPGCLPARDWSRRVLDAHAEGFAAVGGSIEPVGSALARRRVAARLRPWAPGGGRNPAFDHPLLLPSLLRGTYVPSISEVDGLPGLERPAHEPWVYDARITMRLLADALS